VDKDPEGYCIHFDRERGICRNWERRPRVCREYHCNSDFLLQVALRQDFCNLAELLKAAARVFIPREQYRRVPLLGEKEKDG
jgi:Fe-S-cluster containining protein